MLQLRVTNTTKDHIQATNEDVLKVDFELFYPAEEEGDDDTVFEAKSFHFPLDTDAETIEGELTKALELANNEIRDKEANSLRDIKEAVADETIEALSGRVIKVEMTEKMGLGDKQK